MSDFDHLSRLAEEPGPPTFRKRRFPWLNMLAGVATLLVVIVLFLPANRGARPLARHAQCANNLKQIALALHNYEQAFGTFPPACTFDAKGRPLHGWRTLILPYLEQGELYRTIDLSRPWDDPANARALATPVAFYQCPSVSIPPNATVYLGVVVPGGAFRPGAPRQLAEFTDDRSRTLMVIEAAPNHAVPWMAPDDASFPLILGIGPESKLNHPGGVNALTVDGTVRFLRASTSAAERRAILSIAGGEDVAEVW